MSDFMYSDLVRRTTPYSYVSHNTLQSRAAKQERRLSLPRMDLFSHHHHACVAHFDEPTFCSSSLSSSILFFPITKQDSGTGLLLNNGSLPSKVGPIIPPWSIDTRVPGGVDVQADVNQGYEVSSEMAATDISTHPDGLAQIDEVDQPLSDTLTLGSTLVQDVRATVVPKFGRTRNIAQSSLPSSSFVASGNMSRIAHIDTEPINVIQQEMQEDDFLEVDDPRRNYDFADFIDDWTILRQDLSSVFDHGSCPDTHLWRPPDDVYSAECESTGCDMQGLRWPQAGQPRQSCLDAREALHPHNLNTKLEVSRPLHDTNWTESEDGTMYSFRSFHSRHRVRFSHYQLRNVVAANNRSDIFYAEGSNVVQTSMAHPSSNITIMDLSRPIKPAASFRITCLATTRHSPFSSYQSSNFLIAGGFYGEYAFLNLNNTADKTPVTGFVTHSSNGLVTHAHSFADRRSGLPQAAFCTNDNKVRLLDLGTKKFTQAFSYAQAINCSATSTDGRLRLLAGDSNNVLLTSADQGVILGSLNAHHDHAFACAWSPNGVNAATAAQDGITCLWDARNWSSPIAMYQSVMSCARSLHFADVEQGGSLIVAENDDVVSVCDPSRSDRRQNIRFFGTISGVALLGGGEEIVIANSDQTVGGLMCFSRSDGAALSSFSSDMITRVMI